MKNKILLIEQTVEFSNELTQEFSRHYDLLPAKSLSEGIEKITNEPDILTVMLAMPAKSDDALAILAQLTEKKMTAAIVVLTESEDEQNVLKCYDLGAELIIPLSQDVNISIERLNKLMQYKQLVHSLSIEEIKLTELVTNSMMQSSFYGACLELITQLQFSANVEDMASYLFDFMMQYGVHCAISFDAPNRHFEFDQQTFYCSPLEKEVFGLLKDKGRIFEFGNRAVFNSPCVSLLIKNMPDKETANYGLFIDAFAKLVPSIEVNFKSLLNKQKLKSTQVQLTDTVAIIKDAVFDLQKSRQLLLDKLVMQIGLSFHEYDFTIEQEAFLTNLIETNVVSQTQNSEQFYEVYQEISQLIDSLKNSQTGQELGYVDVSASNDVELF